MHWTIKITGWIIGLVGFYMVATNSNLWMALGVAIMITGNEVDRKAKRNKLL